MMLLSPKKTKFRKEMRRLRQIRGVNSRCNTLCLGNFGVMSEEGFWMTNRQFEAVRLSVVRIIKQEKNTQLFFRVFPHKPYTKKPLQVRMGSGKGAVEGWVATIRPKTLILEMKNVSLKLAEEAFKAVKHRLPVTVTLMGKEKEVEKNDLVVIKEII